MYESRYCKMTPIATIIDASELTTVKSILFYRLTPDVVIDYVISKYTLTDSDKDMINTGVHEMITTSDMKSIEIPLTATRIYINKSYIAEPVNVC